MRARIVFTRTGLDYSDAANHEVSIMTNEVVKLGTCDWTNHKNAESDFTPEEYKPFITSSTWDKKNNVSNKTYHNGRVILNLAIIPVDDNEEITRERLGRKPKNQVEYRITVSNVPNIFGSEIVISSDENKDFSKLDGAKNHVRDNKESDVYQNFNYQRFTLDPFTRRDFSVYKVSENGQQMVTLES